MENAKNREKVCTGMKVKLITKTIGAMTLKDFLKNECNASKFYRENGYLPVLKIYEDKVVVGDKISAIDVRFDDIIIIE